LTKVRGRPALARISLDERSRMTARDMVIPIGNPFLAHLRTNTPSELDAPVFPEANAEKREANRDGESPRTARHSTSSQAWARPASVFTRSAIHLSGAQSQSKHAPPAHSPQNASSRSRSFLRARCSVTLALLSEIPEICAASATV